ncbi:hypothetical protein [Acetobacterium woodii]|nr:hypothetical protein [Acetobacterium woodii]
MLEIKLEDDHGYFRNDYAIKKLTIVNKKTATSSMWGSLTIDISKDHNGEFEQQVVKKHQTDILIIENFNRQLRKVTKSKSIFLIDDAFFKMINFQDLYSGRSLSNSRRA